MSKLSDDAKAAFIHTPCVGSSGDIFYACRKRRNHGQGQKSSVCCQHPLWTLPNAKQSHISNNLTTKYKATTLKHTKFNQLLSIKPNMSTKCIFINWQSWDLVLCLLPSPLSFNFHFGKFGNLKICFLW